MMVSANSAIWVSAEPIVAGPNRLRNSLTSSSSVRPAERRQHALARRVGRQQQHFEAARDEHAPGRRVAGGREEKRERQRRHHREVEQDRRRRGGGEAAERVEDAAVERHQRDQQQIGKRDARELDRERKLAGIVGEARRQQRDHRRREGQRDRQQHDLACEQEREHAVGEQPRRIGAALLADARIGRHEGGVERALGKDRAEMIGQAQRHEEGVRDRARAQDGRQHDVARKAGDARQQREAADREDAPDHRPRSRDVDPMPRSRGRPAPQTSKNRVCVTEQSASYRVLSKLRVHAFAISA